MSVLDTAMRTQVKIDYKSSYDSTGELELPAWGQTFSYVNESATNDQLYAYVKALADLTVYKNSPYKIGKVVTTTLVNV